MPESVLLPNPYDNSQIKKRNKGIQDNRDVVVSLLQQLLHEYLYKGVDVQRPYFEFMPSKCSRRLKNELEKIFSNEENFFTDSQMPDERILEVLKKIAPFFAPTKDNLQKMPLIPFLLENAPFMLHLFVLKFK